MACCRGIVVPTNEVDGGVADDVVETPLRLAVASEASEIKRADTLALFVPLGSPLKVTEPKVRLLSDTA
jgi:hypothetical protein